MAVVDSELAAYVAEIQPTKFLTLCYQSLPDSSFGNVLGTALWPP